MSKSLETRKPLVYFELPEDEEHARAKERIAKLDPNDPRLRAPKEDPAKLGVVNLTYTTFFELDAFGKNIFPNEIDPGLYADGSGFPTLTPEEFRARLEEVKEERRQAHKAKEKQGTSSL